MAFVPYKRAQTVARATNAPPQRPDVRRDKNLACFTLLLWNVCVEAGCPDAHSKDELRAHVLPVPECGAYTETGRCDDGARCRKAHEHGRAPASLYTLLPDHTTRNERGHYVFPCARALCTACGTWTASSAGGGAAAAAAASNGKSA